MNLSKINELVSFGAAIDVQVTPSNVKGEPAVNIRDHEFTCFVTAALYLQQIQHTELPDNAFLVA